MRLLALVLLICVSLPAAAVAATAAVEKVSIAFVTEERATTRPVSPLDREIRDEGLAGARLGIADNQTTGRFTGRTFGLSEHLIKAGDDPAELAGWLSAQGTRFVVADLGAASLLAFGSAPQASALLIFNSRAPDDSLRAEDCRANLLHTVPSRAMQADALAQYFAFKRWTRWLLLVGAQPDDALFAAALRRAAARFGAEIVGETAWTFKPGNARTDTGHVTLQSEIPVLTRGPDHDVLMVADEADEFGEYLSGRTALPRPVAGTHGIVATGFSPVSDQWGATQLHSRFEALAGRRMGAVDYAAWLAVRSIGEATTRTGSTDAAAVAAYLRGSDFLLAGFKGQGQSFRPWDGQMRQPMLVAGPRMLISVSPQPGFLHQGSELDTLGVDRGESRCVH